MKLSWGQENPIYRQMFTSTFMPEATAEDMDSFNGFSPLRRTRSEPAS